MHSGLSLRCWSSLLKVLRQFLQGAANISPLVSPADVEAEETGFGVLPEVEQVPACLCLGTPLSAPDICRGAPAAGLEPEAVEAF